MCCKKLCAQSEVNYTVFFNSPVLNNKKYTAMQITAEKAEPKGAAIPIGKRLSGNSFAAKYAPGILTKIMETKL